MHGAELSRRLENSKCKLLARRSFIAEGWNALHQAALDAGAEVDYYPPDHPEVAARNYIDPAGYEALVGPLVRLSGTDIPKLGLRASTAKASIWRWVRKTAAKDAADEWKFLSGVRRRASLVGAFSDYLAEEHLAGAPKFPTNPVSVARYGYWLIHERALQDEKPILPIVWGLALIGATWQDYLRSGYCKFCFRRSKPGAMFCDWHSQGGISEKDRSNAYLGYRRGRRARDLAIERGLGEKLWPSAMARQMAEKLALPDVLFQMKPTSHVEDEYLILTMALAASPRIVEELGGSACLKLPYDGLLSLLTERIDPYEWELSVWPQKISQAEIWSALEEEASPGKRGKGVQTQELVKQAIKMAKAGKRSSDIATELGVTPATVSRWLKRYPELLLVLAQTLKRHRTNRRSIQHYKPMHGKK